MINKLRNLNPKISLAIVLVCIGLISSFEAGVSLGGEAGEKRASKANERTIVTANESERDLVNNLLRLYRSNLAAMWEDTDGM